MELHVIAGLPRHASTVALGAAMFAGCFNPAYASFKSPSMFGRSAAPNHTASEGGGLDSSTIERLVGSAQVKCHKVKGMSGAFSVTFSTSGAATGPYPGTFTAAGTWGVNQLEQASFDESFTITSGASTISGGMSIRPDISNGLALTCMTFGPAVLRYTSSIANGRAKIETIQKGGDFDELLHRL